MDAPRRDESLRLCPAIAFDRIVGGKYKLRILWLLEQRPHRYGELRREIACGSLGAEPTPRILSRELKELQQRGLISRRQYDVVPPRVEYSITELGQTIMPIVSAIVQWGLAGSHERILDIAGAGEA
ncbi:MAG TPA: helix-turn-helix domain-containing protein [Sphingomicrobium sp.]